MRKLLRRHELQPKAILYHPHILVLLRTMLARLHLEEVLPEITTEAGFFPVRDKAARIRVGRSKMSSFIWKTVISSIRPAMLIMLVRGKETMRVALTVTLPGTYIIISGWNYPYITYLLFISSVLVQQLKIKLDTPEAIAKWIEDRKKRWPSAQRVEEKVGAILGLYNDTITSNFQPPHIETYARRGERAGRAPAREIALLAE